MPEVALSPLAPTFTVTVVATGNVSGWPTIGWASAAVTVTVAAPSSSPWSIGLTLSRTVTFRGAAVTAADGLPSPVAFTARTWNLNDELLLRLPTRWLVVEAELPDISVQASQPALFASSRYSHPVIVALPGSVQESRTFAFPDAAAKLAGAAGIIVAVASSDAAPLPVAFTARSSKP